MSDPRRIAHAQQLLEEIGVSSEDDEVYLRILFFCGHTGPVALTTAAPSEQSAINRLKDAEMGAGGKAEMRKSESWRLKWEGKAEQNKG